MGRFVGRGGDIRQIAGHPSAGCHGNRHRARDRAARGHLLGDSPGYGRRLRGAYHRHHRPGHAELLVGHYGHALPLNLEELVALDAADTFLRRPVGQSRDVPHSQSDSGNGHCCQHHAPDAHHDAGGAPAGLLGKGLKERVVVLGHALKNAFIPVVTLIGMELPILVGGSVIMENIFNLPGLCRLFLNALQNRDYPVVSGVNLFFAAGVMLFNLLIDLIYPNLDPRVRYE